MKTELVHSFSSSSLSSLGGSGKGDGSNLGLNGEFPERDIFGNKSCLDNCCTKFCSTFCKVKTISKKFPILRWLPQYTTEKFVSDIVAGFTVGLTILPQGLAFAAVAGVPPQYGLYAGLVGSFVYIVFGGTEFITIGPTAIMSIITNVYTNGKPPAYAVNLCFINGIVTAIFGILQLGFIVNFISVPVNSGFTSAAALTIMSTQLKGLFGLKFPAEGFLPTIIGFIEHFCEMTLWDPILSLICIILLLILMKLQIILGFIVKRNIMLAKIIWFISTSRNAFIVICCTVLSSCLGENQPFSIIGKIVPGLPEFQIPPFSIYDPKTNKTESFAEILASESSAIIVVPFLSIVEHFTAARAFASGVRVDASQEMFTIGVVNILGSFVGSIPVTGSFSRSTVSAMSGAKSPLGGLLTGAIVILALSFLTPYFYYIPKASLAAVICCAVAFTIDYEIVLPLWRSKRMDLIPWFVTLMVSLFVGLQYGMMVGIVISVIYLLYYSARPAFKVKRGTTTRGSDFLIVEMDRSMTFPSVEYMRYVVGKSCERFGASRLPLVLDCVHIQYADFTAAKALKDLFNKYNVEGTTQVLVLYRPKESLLKRLNGIIQDFPYCSNELQLEIFIDTVFGTLSSEVHTPFPEIKRDKFISYPLN